MIRQPDVQALNDPYLLPLSWTTRGGEAGDEHVGRLRRGVLESGEVLAAEYRRISSARLVILGEPGAGKSILALILALGLLHDRRDAPVPVLLTAASWNPVAQGLDDWIVGPLAITHYGGNRETPQTLLRERHLLPIIDGFDEIPEAGRRVALRALRREIGYERPIVITCRAAEYDELITPDSAVLRRAPVARIQPLPREDVLAYLREVDAVNLAPVLGELTRDPEGPAAQALSTLLMVSLARQAGERRTVDLANGDSRTAVEDLLVDATTGAATAGKERWLTFLAHYLYGHRERELAWWLLAPRLVSSWGVTALGLCAGMLLAALASAWMLISGSGAAALNDALLLGGAIGAGFAVLVVVAWYVGGVSVPGRLAFQVAGSATRLRRGAAIGLCLAAIVTVPVLLTMAGVITFAHGWTPGNVSLYLTWLAMSLALTAVLAAALAVYRWLDAPRDSSAATGPATLLAEDRRSALTGALVVGVVVGLGLGPALLVSRVAVRLLQSAVAGWAGEPALADIAAVELADSWSFEVLLLPGALLAVLTLLIRAWPRFV
ncbi:hypothetical protein GCM10009733_007650 [Nonomuraea maheshkhaliensis]|uniref:NACHT domain-containing protein n=1 Tax=Nonomuraea maheshkhaliensis TaxID=419590 RepID=A0ABN2EQP3_9ACTN